MKPEQFQIILTILGTVLSSTVVIVSRFAKLEERVSLHLADDERTHTEHNQRLRDLERAGK